MNDRAHFIDTLHYRLFCWLERDVSGRSGSQHVEGGRIAIATDIGSDRDENQDRVIVLRSGSNDGSEYALIVVCDGMGGMQDGRTCAALAASGVIVSFLRSQSSVLGERMQNAARDANHAVHLKYRGKGGATLSAVCLSSSGAICGLNIGDSRIYGLAPGKLIALSVDDTLAGQIGREGSGPEANSLLQYVGIGPDIEPHVVDIPDGTNRLVLTTDGAHCIPHDALNLLATRARTAMEASRRIVQTAQWMGSRDNGTVACIELPLHRQAASVERSIRLWDPWGELNLLNSADHRPSPIRHDIAAADTEGVSKETQQPPQTSDQLRRDRSEARRKRRGSQKVSERSLLPQNKAEQQATTVEVTIIPEDSSESER